MKNILIRRIIMVWQYTIFKRHLKNIKKSETWKTQLTIATNFCYLISFIDNDEEHGMYSKSNNIEIMINDEADEVIKKLSDLLKNRYQNNLRSIKGSAFIFNYGQLLYYKCHRIKPNYGGSYIDSLNWIKNKRAKTNPINKKENKCFQYAIIVAINHEQIKKIHKE